VLLRLLGKIGNVVVILADKLHIRIQPDVDLDANMCEGGGGGVGLILDKYIFIF
jgi:hypothetical protein